MKQYLIIIVSAVSKKLDSAFGMSVAVTFVMALATAATWPIYTYLLVPNGLDYLQTIAFILIIAALVQFIEIVMKKYIPALHKALGIYLPLITTNCAVLGIDGQLDRFRSWLYAGHGDFLGRAFPRRRCGWKHSQGVSGHPDHTDGGCDLLCQLYGLQRNR